MRRNVSICLTLIACLFLAPMVQAACFPRLRAVVRAAVRPLQAVRMNSCAGSVRQASCAGSMQTSCAGSVQTVANYADTAVPASTVYIGKGSAEFAARLNQSGRLYHDPYYIGYENVSYGSYTPEGAVQQWLKSPGHRANLPFITDIKCNGPFCVGR